MTMLVGCIRPPKVIQPPAPEQPAVTTEIPHVAQPTAPNPPTQSWDTQHPATTTPETVVPIIPEPTTPIYYSTPYFGGWSYSYTPPAPRIVYGIWNATISIEIEP